MTDIEKIIDQLKAEEEIRCPFCNKLKTDDEGDYPVTYWGREEIYTINCEYCNQTFYVCEEVRRTYIVSKDKNDKQF